MIAKKMYTIYCTFWYGVFLSAFGMEYFSGLTCFSRIVFLGSLKPENCLDCLV